MNQNIIEVQNIINTYEQGNDLGVDDSSFYIKQGEIVALLSPNGAGKTTTISIRVDWRSII
ncbi:MAG: ATP-binding cassette domain-containing protein [Promethearchaeota archaeon]